MQSNLPVLDPSQVLLVLLAGIGLVLAACAIGYAAARLLDLTRAALVQPGRSPQ